MSPFQKKNKRFPKQTKVPADTWQSCGHGSSNDLLLTPNWTLANVYVCLLPKLLSVDILVNGFSAVLCGRWKGSVT